MEQAACILGTSWMNIQKYLHYSTYTTTPFHRATWKGFLKLGIPRLEPVVLTDDVDELEQDEEKDTEAHRLSHLPSASWFLMMTLCCLSLQFI